MYIHILIYAHIYIYAHTPIYTYIPTYANIPTEAHPKCKYRCFYNTFCRIRCEPVKMQSVL